MATPNDSANAATCPVAILRISSSEKVAENLANYGQQQGAWLRRRLSNASLAFRLWQGRHAHCEHGVAYRQPNPTCRFVCILLKLLATALSAGHFNLRLLGKTGVL
jgi:hypothetical protein